MRTLIFGMIVFALAAAEFVRAIREAQREIEEPQIARHGEVDSESELDAIIPPGQHG